MDTPKVMSTKLKVLAAVSKYQQAEMLEKAAEFAEEELSAAVKEIPTDYIQDYVQRTAALQEAIDALETE